jgi:hypothetical protein
VPYFHERCRADSAVPNTLAPEHRAVLQRLDQNLCVNYIWSPTFDAECNVTLGSSSFSSEHYRYERQDCDLRWAEEPTRK